MAILTVPVPNVDYHISERRVSFNKVNKHFTGLRGFTYSPKVISEDSCFILKSIIRYHIQKGMNHSDLRKICFFYADNIDKAPQELMELWEKFRPKNSTFHHIMVQKFLPGYSLQMHHDGDVETKSYAGVSIINVAGSAEFCMARKEPKGVYMGKGEYKYDMKDATKLKVGAGDVVHMNTEAAHNYYHGVPEIKEERYNIVIRYGVKK